MGAATLYLTSAQALTLARVFTEHETTFTVYQESLGAPGGHAGWVAIDESMGRRLATIDRGGQLVNRVTGSVTA